MTSQTLVSSNHSARSLPAESAHLNDDQSQTQRGPWTRQVFPAAFVPNRTVNDDLGFRDPLLSGRPRMETCPVALKTSS